MSKTRSFFEIAAAALAATCLAAPEINAQTVHGPYGPLQPYMYSSVTFSQMPDGVVVQLVGQNPVHVPHALLLDFRERLLAYPIVKEGYDRARLYPGLPETPSSVIFGYLPPYGCPVAIQTPKTTAPRGQYFTPGAIFVMIQEVRAALSGIVVDIPDKWRDSMVGEFALPKQTAEDIKVINSAWFESKVLSHCPPTSAAENSK